MKKGRTSMKIRRGFTLIELLVVIAIIAILAAILFPVFAQARTKARQTSDLSNIKQITLAILMYVQDYDELMPTAGNYADAAQTEYYPWYPLMVPYIKNVQVFVSPQYAYQWDSNVAPSNSWYWPPLLQSGLAWQTADGVAHIKISYGANNTDQWGWLNTCGGVLGGWTDGSNGNGHHGPMAPNWEPSPLASIDLPADEILLINAKYPDLWAASDHDFLVNGQQPCGFSPVGYFTWTSTDPNVIGAFNGWNNIGWVDGHAKAKRMFTTCPHEWTDPDDAQYDPLSSCRVQQ